MVEAIERSRLMQLIEDGSVQVVDVLTAAEYQREHIPGAVSIPLRILNMETTRVLDRSKPVAVY